MLPRPFLWHLTSQSGQVSADHQIDLMTGKTKACKRITSCIQEEIHQYRCKNLRTDFMRLAIKYPVGHGA